MEEDQPMKRARYYRMLAIASALCLLASAANGQSSSSKGDQVTENQAESAAIEAIDAFIASQKIDKSGSDWKQHLPRPPVAKFDQGKTYYWQLETSVGDIKLRLMPDVAPMHVTSTIYLTHLGFYDGVAFHRVITGFMAQGGDPTGTGRGGPGYRYDGEFSPEVKHDRKGLLSMANAGPGTDGSQFFITFVPTPHLDGRHSILGEVVEGMGTLDELEKRGSRGGKPSERLEIRRASISVE
jgi:cyclophilin family peptidyl-prolyl cis-trans isomerase